MKRMIKWLGENRMITLLMAGVLYVCIVLLHDEVTTVMIKLRNALGRDAYNSYVAWVFLVILLAFVAHLAYYIGRESRKKLYYTLAAGVSILMVISFKMIMVYSIEAIHFLEYCMLAMLLLPVLKSYGDTVFVVAILGTLDELFQYRFLTPDFEYFDFNDCFLNLVGAGAGAVLIFTTAGDAVRVKQRKWYRSAGILAAAGLLVLFLLLRLTGKITISPAGADATNWFSINRKEVDGDFWKEAYPGRYFHLLRPYEGIVFMYFCFIAFFLLDYLPGSRPGLSKR
jgi:glycopeptide antibiotics resistance protein